MQSSRSVAIEAVGGGPLPARLADLEARVARAVQSSRSPATLKAYRADWADFARWCHGVGLESLPASPGTVAAYIAELADPPDGRSARAVSTITRRLAAIGEGHKAAGHPNPCVEQLVRGTLKGIRRIVGVAADQKKALSTADVRTAVGELGDRLLDHRDRLILLLGFAGGFRRSELAALDVADLEAHPEGLLVHLRKSKTDPESAGRRIEIVYGASGDTCPVRAHRRWLEVAGIDNGPVFRQIDRHGNLLARRLSPQGIAIAVKRHVGRIGYDLDAFAGHSLRRGHATQAARGGAPERMIMRTTGHRSIHTLRSYIEDSELFADPSSGRLGL